MTLDYILNRDILHSFCFHCFLIIFVLDGEVNNKDEIIMRFSFSTPMGITRGIKRIWESKMGTPYSDRIIKDVDIMLKALEVVYHKNGAAV